MSVKNILYQSLILILCLLLLVTPALAITASVETKESMIIYFANGDWGFTPANISVSSQDKYLSALNYLLEPEQLPVGCYDEFPDGFYIQDYIVENDIAYISINEDYLNEIDKDLYAIPLMQDIIGYNVFNFDESINEIKFLSKELPSEKFNNLKRDSFFEKAKLINVGKVQSFLNIDELVGKSPEERRAIIQQAILKEKGSDIFVMDTNYKVCIDPGHGGTDPGAVVQNVKEKDINLDIGLETRNELNSWTAVTFNVVMTRDTDTSVSLTTRYNIANNNNVDCFVSIHCNTASTSSPSGCTAIYPNNHDITNSKYLATRIVSAIDSMTSLSQFGSPYMDNRNLAVLRGTQMPAAIVECGFMTNSSDLSYLINNPDDIGQAIGAGISFWCQLYA